MDHVRRYIEFFESLEPGSLAAIGDYFAERARFADPFNDVSGVEDIRAVFGDMFARCEAPRFAVDECVGDGAVVYLRWTFRYGRPSTPNLIRGVSRVRFDPTGRAEEHVDYWDPARQLYETLPVIGTFCRALRRRLGTPGVHRTRPDTTTSTER